MYRRNQKLVEKKFLLNICTIFFGQYDRQQKIQYSYIRKLSTRELFSVVR